MLKPVLVVSLALVFAHYMGINSMRFHIVAVSLVILIGGVRWLFLQKLPKDFVRNLVIVIAGPALIIGLVQMFVTRIKTLSIVEASLLVFVVAGVLAYVARRVK